MEIVRPLAGPGETATPWEKLTPELEQLTRLNFVAMLIVIVRVVVIMAAGLSNTILVSVMDRYREFGVLKAMGVTPWEIVRLIVTETAVMCVAAGAIGLLAGAAATLAAGRAGIDLSRFTSMNPHFVMSSVVYPRLTAQMTIAPALSVLCLGLAASAWPGWSAARRSAAEVMRMAR
jgi:ABC-type antimicrobial peptide transport system permease subunit